MLYTIIAVVVVAIIFLVVYNMRAAKKGNSQANMARKPTADAEPKMDKVQAESVQVKPEQGEPVLQAEPSQPDRTETASGGEMTAQESGPNRQQAVKGYKKHNDNQYRQALRQFSTQEESVGKEDASIPEAPVMNKDDDFREALRSISKQD
ncbi:hypothetical protein [Paenibacillus thalictri]|uniref:Uncharacterized protein n=1 Tax=Paenibacillus thalictri TaxID=2527873 RepID=A0A4Q9DRY7_9BACL|nr:hypothetical protein [Paenibacillus thalictri]TBL78126.1 hypothetical protein EYB31_14675 [Paenibacillus thalictri]